MQYAYYPGCSLQQSAAMLDRQTRLVMRELGLSLREIPDWNCCGATSASKRDDLLEVAMPARNMGIAEAGGMREMLIPCSACYSKTVVAKYRLQADPQLRSEINSELRHKVSAGINISSVLDPLYDAASSGELKQRLHRTLPGLVAASYYGCMLTRFPLDVPLRDNEENPGFMDTVLETCGARTVDWNLKTYCCGASAAVYDKEATLPLMAKIFSDALSRGANCLVTLCPVCQMNMDAYQEKYCSQHGIQERMPVYFITGLVGYALGLEVKQLQVDRHFVETTPLLSEVVQKQQQEEGQA